MSFFACLDDDDETPKVVAAKVVPKKDDKAKKVAPVAAVAAVVVPVVAVARGLPRLTTTIQTTSAAATAEETPFPGKTQDGNKHKGPSREKKDAPGASGPRTKHPQKPNSDGFASQKDPVQTPISIIIDFVKSGVAQDGADTVVAAETTAAVEANPESTPEVVVPTFTFEEHMAKRNEARANAELFGVKTSVRTVAAESLAGLEEKKAAEEENFMIGKNKGSKGSKGGGQRSTARTSVTDLGFKQTVQESDKPSAGRGGVRGDGRGDGRGAGGRGSPRGSPRGGGSAGGASSSVNINDADSFPSL